MTFRVHPLTYRFALLLTAALACGPAMAAPADGEETVFTESFADGLGKWLPQGASLQPSVVPGGGDSGPVARLDNSAGDGQAFLGVKAGPTDTTLEFSFRARAGSPGTSRVGLHRYAGPIRWVEIGGDWRRVSCVLRSHPEAATWYIVVPARGVVLVDDVQLRRVELTREEKDARLRAARAESERTAVAAYQAVERVLPAGGEFRRVRDRFPLGFYIVRETGRGLPLGGVFRELASGGANLMHNSDFEDWPEHAPNYAIINGNARAARYLSEADAAGTDALMAFDRMMVMRSNLDGIRERVRALKDSPGLWGWYLIDEPDCQDTKPEVTRRAYDAVKAIDPRRPVVVTVSDPKRIAEYADSLDVVITDTYPVSVRSLFSIAPAVETALAATGGRKPVWAAIQVSNNDLHIMRVGSELGLCLSEPRVPTVEEVRCMAYLAIAHGAEGILYFAYDAIYMGQVYDDHERYRGILALTREVSALSRDLCGKCLAKGAVKGRDGTLVSYIVRGGEEKRALLVAVNAFDRAAGPVEVPLPWGGKAKVDLARHGVAVKQLKMP